MHWQELLLEENIYSIKQNYAIISPNNIINILFDIL